MLINSFCAAEQTAAKTRIWHTHACCVAAQAPESVLQREVTLLQDQA
jgi:hypothetical protein